MLFCKPSQIRELYSEVMKTVRWLVVLFSLALTIVSCSATTATIDIVRDLSPDTYTVALELPAGSVVTPANFQKPTQIKWASGSLLLSINTVGLGKVRGKEIRSSNTARYRLQVFQTPDQRYALSFHSFSNAFRGLFISCSTQDSLATLEQIETAIKVCDSARITRLL